MDTKKNYGNFSDTLEKRNTKGLLRGYHIYPEPWEAAVGAVFFHKLLPFSILRSG